MPWAATARRAGLPAHRGGPTRPRRDGARGAAPRGLLARINLVSSACPLAERRWNVEPNLDYELDRWAAPRPAGELQSRAREAFLAFAVSPRPGGGTSATSARPSSAWPPRAGGGSRRPSWRRRLTPAGGRADARCGLLERFLPAPVAEQLDPSIARSRRGAARLRREPELSEAGAPSSPSRAGGAPAPTSRRIRKYLGGSAVLGGAPGATVMEEGSERAKAAELRLSRGARGEDMKQRLETTKRSRQPGLLGAGYGIGLDAEDSNDPERVDS